MYVKIKPEWKGEKVVILASGTSLTKKQLNTVKKYRKENKCKVIAINANYIYAPFADIIYFCDFKFYSWHMCERLFNEHKGRKITITPELIPAHIDKMKAGSQYGLSKQSDTLNTGRNSGYQCINLAYLLGATRIILLGYDMNVGSEGSTHHHKPHPQATDPTVYKKLYSDILKQGIFESIATDLHKENVEIVNCNMNSAIDCFSKMHLEAAFHA